MEQELLLPVTASRVATLTKAAQRYAGAAFLAEDWLEARGIDQDTSAGFGLGVVTDPIPEHDYLEGWLSIPYRTRSGDVTKIRFRCIEDHDGESCRDLGHGKYLDVSGSRQMVFNASAILTAADEISITEGECLTGDAEVLTPTGWVRLDEYSGQDVAQYSESGELDFVHPEGYIVKPFDGDLVEYSNRQRFYSLTTPGHRLPAFTEKKHTWRFVTAADGATCQSFIPRSGRLNGPGTGYSDDEKALAIAISADASIRRSEDGWAYGPGGVYVVFGLKKARKVQRLSGILDRLGVTYSRNPEKRDGYTSICFHLRGRYKEFGRILRWDWLTRATAEELEFMLSELRHWNGNGVPNRTREECSSKHLGNAQWVQTLCHITGRVSTVMPRRNEYGEWFKVSILHRKSGTSWQSLRGDNKRVVPHAGLVYCLKVPSSAFLVRQGGCISVTGNCDAMILTQLGLPAVAFPGAKSWHSHHRRMFAGFQRVFVWADPDEAGRELAGKIQADLPRAQMVPLSLGDVNETFLRGGVDAINDALDRLESD